MYNVIYVTARMCNDYFKLLAQKHIKYRYHNASHVMYNVIYVSLFNVARHVQ